MNLIQRVTNISLNPRTEWEVIAPEATSTGSLLRSYIAPLAAIGPAASFVGLSLLGVGLPLVGTYRIPIAAGLTSALIQYVLALVSIFLVAMLINALAPGFGAEKNRLQALKLAAYASTPAWIAGVLLLMPVLGILGLLAGLYSLYLLYLGLPVMMKAPHDRIVGYTAVIVICVVVIALVGGAVAGVATGGAMLSGAGVDSAAVSELQRAAQRIEQAGKAAAQQTAARPADAQPSAVKVAEAVGAALGAGVRFAVVDQARLKALLPDALPGLARSGIEAEKMQMAGLSVSVARAGYGGGEGDSARSIDVSITDTGGATLFTSMAAWGLTEQDKETANAYEKMGKVNGWPTHERFNKDRSDSEYSVLVGERFMVETRGRNVDMAALKNAFNAVAPARLEAMKDDGPTR